MTSTAATFEAAGGFATQQERKPVNKWLVTVSITFGTLMGAIDASIVNVAVPHLTGSLGVTVEQITWVTTGFVIATVMVMPLTGFLARLFGQKRVYMVCLALFIIGSALCGMVRTLPLLVLFRILQGLGAGALQPTEQAILRQTFPPKEQGMAMALFGMAVVLGPAFGPTLGGYIVDNYSWPWIFYINVPIGIISLLMVSRFVHEPEDVRAAMHQMAARQRKNMDWGGIALLFIGLGTMQYVLEEGNRNDWFQSGEIKIITLVAVVSLVALVIRELSARVPAVDFSLFKDVVFTSGTLIGAVMFAMLMAVTFLLPLFMQFLLGFSATQAGLAMMPRSLCMLVVMPIVGRSLQQSLAAPRRRLRHRALRVHRLAHGALHAGHVDRGRDPGSHHPGRRLQLPLDPADDDGPQHDPASPIVRRHGTELAAAPDRWLGRPGGVRDAAGPLRHARPRRHAVSLHDVEPGHGRAHGWHPANAAGAWTRCVRRTARRRPHDRRAASAAGHDDLVREAVSTCQESCSSAFCRWSSF